MQFQGNIFIKKNGYWEFNMDIQILNVFFQIHEYFEYYSNSQYFFFFANILKLYELIPKCNTTME